MIIANWFNSVPGGWEAVARGGDPTRRPLRQPVSRRRPRTERVAAGESGARSLVECLKSQRRCHSSRGCQCLICTELAKKVCPRLRDLATSPAGGITQPRARFFANSVDPSVLHIFYSWSSVYTMTWDAPTIICRKCAKWMALLIFTTAHFNPSWRSLGYNLSFLSTLGMIINELGI